MPPKRGRPPAPHRSDEAERLPGSSIAPAAASAPPSTSSSAAALHNASARRPHHLVSRLHPPWGNTATSATSGTALRTSGVTPNVLSTAGTRSGAAAAGKTAATPSSSTAPPPPHRVAEPASDAAEHTGSRRAPATLLPTRVSGCSRVTGRTSSVAVPGQRHGVGGRSATRRGQPKTATPATTFPASAGRKRLRSTSNASSSNPIEIAEEVEEDVDEGDGSEAGSSSGGSSGVGATAHGAHARPEVTQLSSSSSSSSSSPSLSPSPVVTERKVWKAADGHQATLGDAAAAAARHDGASTAGQQTSVNAASGQSKNAAGEGRAVSPGDSATPAKATTAAAAATASAPTHYTAASTADSKVLFAEDEDDEEEPVSGAQGGGVAWSADRRRTEARPPPAAEETHVLGELSENASITPARPAAPPLLAGTPSGSGSTGDSGSGGGGGRNAARRHGRLDGKAGDGEEEEVDLLGEPRDVPESHLGLTEGPAGEMDEARPRGAATPSRQHAPAHHGVSTPAPRSSSTHAVAAAAAAGLTFAETLAVQDLSLLAEDGGNSGGLKSAVAAAAQHLSQGVEELLLGEGVVSPPVKRVTATPQQVAHDASRATADAAQEAVHTRDPRQKLVMDGANSSPACSLVTPPPPPTLHAEAHEAARGDRSRDKDDDHTTARATAQSTTGPSHPAPGSLPSTLDDGLWKGGEEEEERPEARAASAEVVDADALALTPRRHTPSQRSSDGLITPLARRLAESGADAAAAAAAWLSAAEGAETVPIDPFLSTPPQLKRASQARQAEAAAEAPSDERHGVGARMRASPARSGRAGAAVRAKDYIARDGSRSPSRTPPRTAKLQPPPHAHPQRHAPVSSDVTAAVVTGADVDAGVLTAGLRVEGRWGRQWFPATISEAPRNGFVQIAWDEDGSLLHVRLREVRLRRVDCEAMPSAHARTPPTSRRGVSPAREKSATPAGGRGNDHVLTATQLVALMEEEDAEDSRHEPEPPHLPTSPAAAVAARRATTPVKSAAAGTGGKRHRSSGRAAEGDEGEQEAPLDQSKAAGVHFIGVPAAADAPGAPQSARRGHSAHRAAGGGRSASRSPAPPLPLPPGEVHPSSLCIVLPQSARRELLHGDPACSAAPSSPANGAVRPSPHAGPAAELQRSTELQRLLHFLSGAGATVVDSLTQADNMAAQIGDRLDEPADVHERHAEPPSSDTRPVPSSTTTTTISQTSATPGVSHANKRKTAGRVPLPRRSSVHAGGAAASTARAPAPRYFVFLVASSPPAANTATPVAAADALAEVTLAHALGVSAVHVSWLWSIAPGTPHVRLPTAQDEVRGAAMVKREERGKWKGAARRPSTTPPPARDDSAPPRLEPFAGRDRALSGREVLFLERDDRMEMWLNAAGAAVRAEPTPAPAAVPPHARLTRSSVLAVAGPANGGGDVTTVGGVVARRRRSESPARSPLPKVPRVERLPDYVHIPLDRPAPAVDLDRLGGVPLLTLAWLADSIEQHFWQHRRGDGSSAAERQPPPPTALADAWPTLQLTLPQQRERSVKQSATPPQLRSPLQRSPPRAEAVVQTAERPQPVASPLRAEATAVLSPKTAASPPRAEEDHTASAPIAAGVAPHPEFTDGEATTGPGASAEAERQRVTGKRPRDADEGTDVTSAPATAEAGGDLAYAPAAAAIDGATHDSVGGHAACTAHPSIAVGEDYYVALSAPVIPPPPPQGLSQQRSPSMLRFPPPVVPATTIVLGRVVDLQLNPAAPRPLSPAACSCRVVLQLYEPKYVSMHVDPRTREVVHQTTVYLARRWATAPGAALLYDTPVYVIHTAARQHVYWLEDALESTEEPHEQTAASWTPDRVGSGGDAQARGARGGNSPLSPGILREVHQEAGSGAIDVSPVTARVAAVRAAQPSRARGTPSREEAERPRSWALRGAETLPLTPVVAAAPPSSSYPAARAAEGRANGERQGGRGSAALMPNARASAVAGSNGATAVAAPHNESTSLPPASDVTTLSHTPDHFAVHGATTTAAVAAGPAVAADTSPPAKAYQLSRLAMPRTAAAGAATSPLRASHQLSVLPVRLGAHTVMLRPSSHVSFYARRSLSVSDRASGRPSMPSERDGGGHKTSPHRLRSSAGDAAHEVAELSDVESNSSEELIAEAPLVGKVEQMREMDNGVVDIVVLTAQPNSVFGGSKMYRITPDMIVDVSP